MCHAGDFVTASVLEAFEAVCDLRAVAGNNDPPPVDDRLPGERVVEWEGLRVGLVHGHEHSDVALELYGRQAGADLVVFGHSHRPAIGDARVPLLNPGSHADPRRYRPSHAELEWRDGRATGRLVEPTGEVFASFEVEPRS